MPLATGAQQQAKAEAKKSQTRKKMDANEIGVSVGTSRKHFLTTPPTDALDMSTNMFCWTTQGFLLEAGHTQASTQS